MAKTANCIILRCVNEIPGSNLDIKHSHTPGIPQAFDKLRRVPLGGNLTSLVDELNKLHHDHAEGGRNPETTPFFENVADRIKGL